MESFNVGKFNFLQEFIIFDLDVRRQYPGKIFVFEKAILHTEVISKSELQLREHYSHTEIALAFESGKSHFYLYNKNRIAYGLELSSPRYSIIQFWTYNLRDIIIKSFEGIN